MSGTTAGRGALADLPVDAFELGAVHDAGFTATGIENVESSFGMTEVGASYAADGNFCCSCCVPCCCCCT